MNLGKVKSFLIVLFLGINIYLIASHFFATRFFVNSKTIKDTVSIVKNHGITVDEDTVIRYTVNLRNVDTNNVVYTKAFKDKNKDNKFKINGNRFAGEFTSEGILEKKDREIISEVKSTLEKYGFSAAHMEFSKIKRTKNGKKLDINCKIKKYTVFDSVITVDISGDKYTLSGIWYEPLSDDISMNSRSRNTVYITSVLMDLIENEDAQKNVPFTITSIDYGYMAGSLYGEGGHVTATALPYYRIKDDKGNVYYYDASSGTYFK